MLIPIYNGGALIDPLNPLTSLKADVKSHIGFHQCRNCKTLTVERFNA